MVLIWIDGLLIKLIYAHDLKNNGSKTKSVYRGKIELLQNIYFNISHDFSKKPIKYVLNTYQQYAIRTLT